MAQGAWRFKMNKFLVFGTSGLVGSNVKDFLINSGFSVRGTSSKEKKEEEVEYVKINILEDKSDQDKLLSLFSDIDAAFLMSPGGLTPQDEILIPLIEAAKKAYVKKVVLMTSVGANLSDETPFRKAELALINSGMEYVIVRPNWFMQDFQTFWTQGIVENNAVQVPAGEGKTSFIDVVDIAEVISKVLTTEKFNGQELDITGSESLSHGEVAEILTTTLGRKITYNDMNADDLANAYRSYGMDSGFVDFLMEILGYLKKGYNSGITNSVEEVIGRKPITFAEYAKKAKGNWIV